MRRQVVQVGFIATWSEPAHAGLSYSRHVSRHVRTGAPGGPLQGLCSGKARGASALEHALGPAGGRRRRHPHGRVQRGLRRAGAALAPPDEVLDTVRVDASEGVVGGAGALRHAQLKRGAGARGRAQRGRSERRRRKRVGAVKQARGHDCKGNESPLDCHCPLHATRSLGSLCNFWVLRLF
jgi:hypothetical protein